MTDPHSNDDRYEQGDVLPAFRPWPTQRRLAKDEQMRAQLPLCDEPDHESELQRQRTIDARRGPMRRDAFHAEVRRQREEQERRDRTAGE
jgi:hypothetical protein